MRYSRRLALFMAMAIGLAACGQSRLNPFNWFSGGPQEETVQAADVVEVIDDRTLVGNITSLSVERTPGGAIIRATALPPTQGWFLPALVNDDRDGEPIDGILSYSFRAGAPETLTRASTPQSRELSAAVFVSDIMLSRITAIRVAGADNIRTVRR